MVRRIVGLSDRAWIVDEREPAAIGARTTPFLGHAEGHEDHVVWVQRLIHGEEWDDDREHMRRAFEIGQIDGIRECGVIAAPIDYADSWDTYLVHELAETDLGRHLREGKVSSNDADEVEANVREALSVLHGLGLVHCDVREDNILQIGGKWQLGDLGGVVATGAAMTAVQKDREYVPAGVGIGSPAAPENDTYALEVVLGHLRRAPGA